MKRVTVLLMTMAMLVTLSMVSCKKDKEDDPKPVAKKNAFVYEGKEYILSGGQLAYYGDVNAKSGPYNFDITLHSSGLVYNANTDEFTGIGDVIYFQMYSSSATDLVPGTYNFDATTSELAGTFDYGFFAVKFDMSNWSSDIQQEITGGTVKIAKSGNTYEITVNVMAASGKAVTAYYKGNLTYVDLSDWKKK